MSAFARWLREMRSIFVPFALVFIVGTIVQFSGYVHGPVLLVFELAFCEILGFREFLRTKSIPDLGKRRTAQVVWILLLTLNTLLLILYVMLLRFQPSSS